MGKNKGFWVDALIDAVGKYVNLETKEGIIREGRISGIRTVEFNVNGIIADVPEELELNGDVGDLVTVSRIASIDIQTGR